VSAPQPSPWLDPFAYWARGAEIATAYQEFLLAYAEMCEASARCARATARLHAAFSPELPGARASRRKREEAPEEGGFTVTRADSPG